MSLPAGQRTRLISYLNSEIPGYRALFEKDKDRDHD
jgi:hypothetical protein